MLRSIRYSIEPPEPCSLRRLGDMMALEKGNLFCIMLESDSGSRLF